MKKIQRKQNKWVIVAIVVGILVLVGVMVAVKLGLDSSGFRISNFGQLGSKLPSSNLRSVEDEILAKMKNERIGNGAGAEGLVRLSSYEEQEITGGIEYEFIVDIDKYKVSYRVSFTVNNTTRKNEDVEIVCPSYKEMKYVDGDCSGGGAGIEAIERYLPYAFEMESGRTVTVTEEYTDKGEKYLRVRASTCGDAEVASEVVEAVREWVMSLGYNPENFEIEKEEFCDVS